MRRLTVLEIVTVRLGAEARASVEEKLARALEDARREDVELQARLYRSSGSPTDLSVHLSRPLAGAAGSTALGLRIAAGLAEVGQVSSSIWVEVERGGEEGR